MRKDLGPNSWTYSLGLWTEGGVRRRFLREGGRRTDGHDRGLCVRAAAIEIFCGVLPASGEVGRDEGWEEIAGTFGVGERGSAGVGGRIPVD